MRVRGWAADPNLPNGPLSVHVYANGQYVASITANKSRTDVASANPGYGTNLGYDSTVALPTGGGTVNVCTYAINAGAGNTNTRLGASRSVSETQPLWSLRLCLHHHWPGSGPWLGRRPQPAQRALSVHVYANGQYVASITANKSRTDVASANPGYGTNLGYDSTLNVSQRGVARSARTRSMPEPEMRTPAWAASPCQYRSGPPCCPSNATPREDGCKQTLAGNDQVQLRKYGGIHSRRLSWSR